MTGRYFRQAWVLSLLVLSASSCATYTPKYEDPVKARQQADFKEVKHAIYLIGDAGLSPQGEQNMVLKQFSERLSSASESSMALFLGDNVYPAGVPDPKKVPDAYAHAKKQLEAQLKTLAHFKGQSIFIPGNHDWYSGGIRGLKRQAEFIEEYLGERDVFLPEKGCPIETVEVTENLLLLVVDSEWYLTDWNQIPSINDACEIKDRDSFWSELESEIKQNAQKTIVLAMHHPVVSYGEHGGQFSLKQQFYLAKGLGPIPGLGSLVNLLRKTSGVSAEDLFNPRYQELTSRMLTLAAFGERVLFVSGHEHTLQYIVEEGIPQIVSGSGAKIGSARLVGGSRFSAGMGGYAVLDIFEDQSSRVSFYGVDETGSERFLFSDEVFPPLAAPTKESFPQDPFVSYKASVYELDETQKSQLCQVLWGDRYRGLYGKQILAPVAFLDTLYGGLTPLRKGGGQQSKSLHLIHASGKQFVMRAIRKQADQNLQALAFPDQYIMDDINGTAPVLLLQDLYTGGHPFASFALGPLSDSLGIFHTNPKLLYIPKQAALGTYNKDFGGELYLVEEQLSEGHADEASFGYAQDIISTKSLFKKLRKDEKYQIVREAFIRARLFDMLIGDWDRHQDQWRWAEFQEEGTEQVLYRPIPRDRDQAFSLMGDGALGGVLTRMVPELRKMANFGPDIRNIGALNTNAFTLDRALLSEASLEEWLAQAAFIRERVNAPLIEISFEGLPPETRDASLEGIKASLLQRLEHLEVYAQDYFKELQRYVLVQGTDKDDWIEIQGAPDGTLQVKAYRIIDGKKGALFSDKTVYPDVTHEVWIYGLDDSDHFYVNLPASNRIRVRIVGGHDKDVYEVNAGKKVVLYDHKSKESTLEGQGHARKAFTDDYELNTYLPLKPGNTNQTILPVLGFNPDDGVKLGASYTRTEYGFERNPFTTRHSLSGAYYFATSGFDFSYKGEFARVIKRWNFQMNAHITSPNFSQNFFGFGNESTNSEDSLGLNYNRVRMRKLTLSPGLVWRGQLGGSLTLGVAYEHVSTEETADRFIWEYYQQSPEESRSEYFGVHGEYAYSNHDNDAYPTNGMEVSLRAGYKRSIQGEPADFGFIVPTLALDHRLLPTGNLVLATRWQAHFNIGNGYTFFQAAQMGANNGPRGYRNERFSGKTAYYQITDLRYQFGQMKTALIPLSLGVFGGFDYGRVWQPGERSNRCHTSYGGGVFVNAAQSLTAQAGLFQGEDGSRFSIGLGFEF